MAVQKYTESNTFILIDVYTPPNLTDYINNFQNLIRQLLNNIPIVVFRDFSCHHPSWGHS